MRHVRQLAGEKRQEQYVEFIKKEWEAGQRSNGGKSVYIPDAWLAPFADTQSAGDLRPSLVSIAVSLPAELRQFFLRQVAQELGRPGVEPREVEVCEYAKSISELIHTLRAFSSPQKK